MVPPDMPQETDNPVTHPILNSPYESPKHHWRLGENFRAIDEKLPGRRLSGAYLSVPNPETKAGPPPLTPVEATAQGIAPHPMINRIRKEVDAWRADGYPGVRRPTHALLNYWSGTDIELRPFFCQVEALETLIWLLEAGPALKLPAYKAIYKELGSVNQERNEGISRLAVKMATGAGKTRVMAMIILWQALISRTRTDILIITPNLTVRDRLGELDPENGTELYQMLCPPGLMFPAGHVCVTIKNFQAFQRRSGLAVKNSGDVPSRIAKKLLKPHGAPDPESWTEDINKMIARILPDHGEAHNIIVLNDEAHHCYTPTATVAAGREEATYEEQAALWFNILRNLKQQSRLGQIFDLSATPMYLRRPVDLSYDLFPWTVSDYPLIDAVEAGLTKIPRVPVKDDADRSDPMPVYRDIYNHVHNQTVDPKNIEPVVSELLRLMHKDYIKLDRVYQRVRVTPVMIIVANTVQNANAFYKHIAGYYDEESETWQRGAYKKFSNVKEDGSGPRTNPPTLLVHSRIDDADAGEGKTVADLQKDFFSPGADATQAERIDWIRRVFNTVGKAGKPGKHIRCIISVSMLTEGWDVRTVTHIFGYRAFGSQLLCEQVAGRALRRTSFPTPDGIGGEGLLQPEYARIFGVPFNFMRGGDDGPPPPPVEEWPLYTVKKRQEFRIAFPNLVAYRVETPEIHCRLDPDRVTRYQAIESWDPIETTAAGVLGEEDIVSSEQKRTNEIVYSLAARAVAHFHDRNLGQDRFARRRVLFASMLQAVRDWLVHPLVECNDLRLLARRPHSEQVPVEIVSACSEATDDKPRIRPVFASDVDSSQPRERDTSGIDCMTTLKHRYPFYKKETTLHSEINAAGCHSGEETIVARELDRREEIVAWARNYRLGWQIPYLDRRTGLWRFYEPDFVVRLKDDGRGPRYIIIEYKGQEGPDSEAKAEAVERWWIPAVDGSDDPAWGGTWKYVLIGGNKDTISQKLDVATGVNPLGLVEQDRSGV